MRKFYPVNLRVERFLKLHPKIRNYQNFWDSLFITSTVRPHGWSLVLLLLLFSSGIKATAQTITNFNTLPAVPVPLYRESAVSAASYAVEGFVFTTVNASPPNPSTQIIFSRQTKSTNDYVLRTSATTVGVGYVSVKKADGSAFKFGGFDFRFAMLTGTGTTHSIFTLTGYKGGSPVANGSVSVNGLPPATYFTLSTSAASGFNDIDEFRYTMQGGTGQTSYIDIDNIVTGPANVAAATAPTVTTAAVTTFNATTATLGGDITSDGGSAVTEKGIVWSTATNPTTANNKVNIGAGAGSFNKAFIGPFTPNTTIYVKAYAINAKGTSYGDEISFKTNALAGTSAVYDFETASGTYTGFDTKTLTATNTASSSSITVTAATDGVFRSSTNGSNTAYFGEEGLYFGWNAQETAFTVAAQNGKSFDLTSFYLTNENNEPTSFLISSAKGSITVAIPGGSPIAANFIDISGNANAAYFKGIKSFTVTPSIPAFMEFDHMVIENIQTAITTPTVATASVTALSATTATLGGNVTADGGASITERGIVYGTSSTPAIGGLGVTKAALGTGMGAFSTSATGLASSTTYYVRAYAINSVGTVYGEQQTFTTPAASNGTNLNAGDMAMTAWSTTNNTVDVVTLKDLSAGTVVNFTDWGWSNPNRAWLTNSTASTGEGNIKWTLSSAVSEGSIIRITYTNGSNITLKNLTTNTAISTADLVFTGYAGITDPIVGTGDNFFIYQSLSTNPNFIFGFNNTIGTTSSPTIDATGWVPTGSFTTGYAIASNLPDGNGSQNTLTNGVNAIGFTSRQTNVAYTGTTTATDAATWLSRFANVNNWTQQGTAVTPSYESANKIIIGSVAATAPIVSTTATSTYAATTATLAGNVSSDGGATVTEKGVVYGTSSNPTTANSKLVNSAAGTGGISVDATGLTPGTTYYFKAYAINSAGTAYGTEQTFTTTASATPAVTTAGTIEAFAACYGSSTTGQSFTISGNNLTGDLVITPPLGFQLSNNNIGFSGVGITLTPVSGTVAATTLYVRMAAATSSPAAGNITVSSAGATTKNIPVSGTVNALPTITTSAITSVSNTATSFSIPYSATTGSPDSYTISTGTRSLTGFAAVNNSVLGTSPINVVIPASSAGTYDFNLRVTNSATGCVSAIVPLTLTITAPAVTAAPVVIVPANGSMVSTATPTYGGTAPAGSTITIYSDGASLANTITANSAGNWAITQPTALTQGAHTVYATAQLSGNSVSANGNTNTFTVDNIRPTVAISSTAGASGGSTGTSPIPFTVTFSEAVTGFVVADLTAVNATITGFAGSGTTYTFNATPAAIGAVTISLPANVAQDAAGNGNTAATQFSITYSQAVTAAPVVIVPANGSMVSTATPTYGGTAPAGSTITIYSDGSSLTNTTTANSAGNWAITQPAALTQGAHTVYATAQLSGNSVSANSNTNTFTVDNIKPTVAISSNKSALKAGETAAITFTFSEDPGATFTWNGSSGDVVLSGGTLSAISGSGAIRNANFTPDANTNDGTASITVAAGSYADAAGNLGSAGVTPSLVFDTQLPPAPVVVTVANGSLTITDKPIYTGTAEAGSTLTVYVDGGSIGTTTASTSGTWSKSQPVALLTGSHTVYALATDAAGNNSANSNTNTFTIDATAPVIASVSVPANGTYVAGENLDFAVEFSESTTVDQLGGTPYLSVTLNTGGVVMAKYVSGSGLSTHTYRYTVKTTDKDLDGILLGSLTLNGGTVKDAAGNNAVLTLNNIASTAGVLVDGTPIVAQTITFNALAAKTYGDADFDLNATASSGLPVSFTSSNAAVASINGKTVTVHKAGVVTITATQAGNSGYSAAQSVSQTLTINAKAIAVTASAQSKVYGTADPALTYTITSGSLVGTDALNGTLTREPGENAGTYIIKQGTLALNANYALTFQTASLGINKATLTATANNQSKVYGQAIPPLTVSYSGFVNGETKTSLTTEAVAVTTATLTSPVGTYTITPSGGSAANYDLAYVNGTLTVTADQPVINFASLPAKTYGDADFAPGAGSTNNNTAISYNSDNAAVATIINGKIHVVGSGLAHITASQAPDANYVAAQSVVQDLVVNKAAITITAAAKSKTYGDADPALTYQVTSGTLKGNDTFSGTLTREPGENAGAYAIKQGTLALTSNYAITFTGADLSISTRAITVAATAKTKTYGDADPAFAYTITTGTLAGNDALTGTLTRNAGETAGSYAIKQGSLSAGNNYALTYTPASLTITQRAVNIAAVSKSKIYGEADPELTYSINGGSLVTGDTFSGSLTREAGEAAGTYAIRQGTVALNNNYVLTYTGANLTIGQALQNITFAGLPAKTYGDADFTAGATSSNTVIPVTYSSDNAAVASIVNGRIHIAGAGTANITASQAGNANYVASQNVTRELTVAKADIAVTAAAKSKTYGEANPALTYSITGGSLKGSDVFTGSLTRNAGENAGTYAIKQGTLALNNNYNLSYEGADLSIGKKAVTVAAAIKSKIYGQADPALTYNITAGTLVGNDSFTGTLSRDAGENIGTYAIKQGTLALNSNYSLTYNGAALEISKKAIAVTANAQNKTYGEADPALTYTFSPALVTGDTFSGSLTRDAGENAGTYAIKQGGLVLSSNYALTYTGGNLTIGKKDLVIKADDQNKRYGEVNPALTVSYNGFANGDDAGKLTAQPVARTAANQASAAGSYDITVTGAASDNYNITYLKGTLTISKAQLTVAAVNQNKTYGEANPQLTVTYSGFLNGDTKANLSAQPVANTAATAQSGAGNYDILVSGAASNSYDIVYTKGTLTINKAPLTITADNKTRTYGVSNPAFTVSYSGFVNSDTQASLSAQPVLGTAANATSGVGAYGITASGAASNNYSIVYNKGILTIAPANRSIVFNRPLQATYGDADFAAGATLSSGETVVYTSDNNSVAIIINGRIHIVGAGTANITASAPVNGNYTSTQPVTQLLTVNKARQTIDFTSIPVLNRVTGKYDLSVVRASSGLPVSFTVADPFIVTLDGNTLKANRIGSTQVTASQAGNANYLAANSVVQTIEVNDADGGNEIVVRQAVSPNGDGVNDFLYIEGIQEHPDNSVTVINRNGVKVFEIKGYDNRSRVFDGRSSITNQMQQAGTYFFLLQYEGKRKTGWFVLKY
ncbi:MBG domain-containing protein [Mucilaginibacter sp. PAMB04168]|uniref:MBG domain-containing protein n=1 Tax=Mucilaginibacter sp. PAMB04168 TaxID=3138567 RepID=UPI0031F72190